MKAARQPPRQKRKFRIALVSDFFCPNTGGIETHLYYLGGYLLKLGHSVIVLTHTYGERRGIRFLSNGLKVYHLPFFCLPSGIILPSVLGSLYWYRRIFLSERVDIVHGHSTFSSIAHEAMLHALCLGIPTVFTDHSLLGFADFHAVLINKLLLRYSLINVQKIICVSHTSKENTVLRAGLSPSSVYVIPNAVNSKLFEPRPSLSINHPTTIVVLSRLVYRKGADLLVEVIPEICRRHKDVRFIIGGDGPKRVNLEEMRERYNLHSRVEMCGMLPHTRVREVLIRGHIFLNTSLTEAFCMAIVEAASCGLHVVSTRVGGIPEVLPDGFITLAEPRSLDIVDALSSAIQRSKAGDFCEPKVLHKAISKMYQWEDVAKRTVIVYKSTQNGNITTKRAFQNYWNIGWVFGIVWIVGFSLNLCLLFVYDLFDSREMEVKNPCCTFITNREALTIIQQVKSSKQKYMRKHNTVVYETVQYLKSTPAVSQNETDIKKLMMDLQKLFDLTPAEMLQIVNLRPKSNVELAMIIEECDERFNEDQLQEMLELILLNLPDNDGAETGNTEGKEARTVSST